MLNEFSKENTLFYNLPQKISLVIKQIYILLKITTRNVMEATYWRLQCILFYFSRNLEEANTPSQTPPNHPPEVNPTWYYVQKDVLRLWKCAFFLLLPLLLFSEKYAEVHAIRRNCTQIYTPTMLNSQQNILAMHTESQWPKQYTNAIHFFPTSSYAKIFTQKNKQSNVLQGGKKRTTHINRILQINQNPNLLSYRSSQRLRRKERTQTSYRRSLPSGWGRIGKEES